MPLEGAARRCQRKGDTIRTVDREVAVDLDANATAAPLTGVVDAMVAAMRNASCVWVLGYAEPADGIPYASGVSEPVCRRGSRPPLRSSS